MISVVIPTLNAACWLPQALERLRRDAGPYLKEIIVADSGSTDGTVAVVRAAGATLLQGPRGRGRQLALGAAAASGDWLLFLHADTRLEPGWLAASLSFMAETGTSDKAAVYTFRLDDEAAKARLLERLVALRVALLALPYGDQGLLMSRRFYEAIGGFAPLPLMEDVDLIRRIGRRRLQLLPIAAVTSAERYRRNGYLLRMLRNAGCLSLFFLGVSPERISRLYG